MYEGFHKISYPQTHIIDKKNFTYRIVLGVINSFLTSPKNILDIGCGVGTISLYLASKGNKVFGIDISENAISASKNSAKFLELKNVTFKRQNFPDSVPLSKFDFIICSEVLEHLKDDNLSLKKIFSLLKKSGIAIISVPSKNAPLFKLGLAKGFDKKVGHLRRYNLEELIDKCKKAGFAILETRRTEGILRNFLFLNPLAKRLIRFIKFFLSDAITYIDEISLRLFGESQIFVVIQKP